VLILRRNVGEGLYVEGPVRLVVKRVDGGRVEIAVEELPGGRVERMDREGCVVRSQPRPSDPDPTQG
jgi:hypothetical protein